MITTIESLKREAKKLSRAAPITHMQALEVIAVQRGHATWGSLAASMAIPEDILLVPGRNTALSNVSATDPRSLLENAFERMLPQIEGCRHLMISGAACRGKTAFLNTLIGSMPGNTRIAAIEDTRELIVPADAQVVTLSRTSSEPTQDFAMERALDGAPQVLLIGEISARNAASARRTMLDLRGPMIATTIHSSSMEETAGVFRARTYGESDLPADVAIVHITSGMHDGRRIAQVARSG
jgi:type IV secretory pathway ATPase VirB11/archaellum biosynthesis ATPase